MAHALESNRESQKVDEQGEPTPNFPLLPGATDTMVHPSPSPLPPDPLVEGGVRLRRSQASICMKIA